MFYISDKKYISDSVLYGITDTEDNVTEYFKKCDVKELMDKVGYTSIKGATYNGHDINFEVKTEVMCIIEALDRGGNFTLNFNGNNTTYTKIGELATGNGWKLQVGDKFENLYKSFLLRHKNDIKIILKS